MLASWWLCHKQGGCGKGIASQWGVGGYGGHIDENFQNNPVFLQFETFSGIFIKETL